MKYYGVYVETASRVLKVISTTALLYCQLMGALGLEDLFLSDQ